MQCWITAFDYGVISAKIQAFICKIVALSYSNACFYNPVFDLYNPTLSIHYSMFAFQNPIFNLFNSTLCIDNSTSIFQILFTYDILVLLLRKTKGHILNPSFPHMSRWRQKPWEGLDCGNRPLLLSIIIRYHYYYYYYYYYYYIPLLSYV